MTGAHWTSISLALLLILAGGERPTLAQGEPPQTVLAVAAGIFPASGVSDLTYDPVADLVYVVDENTGATWSFTHDLLFVSIAPSPFPGGAVVSGIGARPTTGELFWSVQHLGNLELWSSPSIATPAALAGTLAVPGAGAVIQGIDCEELSNRIIVNDHANAQVSAHSLTGGYLGIACSNPFGPSSGVSQLAGQWIDLSSDPALPGGGPPTTWRTSNAVTCSALDAVGIPLPAGVNLLAGFDHGPAGPAGEPTLYTIDATSGTITWYAIHRPFVRSEVNGDGNIDIADLIFLLDWLFFPAAPPPPCMDAGDVNDDGIVDLGDVVFGLTTLFSIIAPPPPPPYPGCGYDPTADALRCNAAACP